ncbi:MFS transporter [Saccharothrix sp. 6-C]|uniref:MFS transporter n=1 Tax=Saccharothrix sp. 6-C TaxID=2781735 RepID=UPI0019177F78|nr:MFS transporter [Saccharothrix sp. 6-C]QQQ80094.1 MFS transporter [Saccharothrix sp. 6-C]
MTPGPRAGRREWWGLVVLVLVTVIISMDMTVLSYALPFISAEQAPTSSQLLWITDIYAFVLSGLLIPMGTLGDRIGRRKLLIIGAALFGVASAASAYAATPEALIGTRALMGAAGATLMPSTMSLIRTMFRDEGQRRAAIGIWASGFSAGGAIGLLVGGGLLQSFHWGSVFLINLPIMLVLVVLAPLLLPEYRNPRAGRFDLLSTLLVFVAVLPVVWGIKECAEGGASTPALVAVVVGLLFVPIFVWRQRGLDDPMVDVRLFRKAAFSAALVTSLLTNFALVGFLFFTSQYLQLVLGLRPFEAGLWSLPQVFTAAIGAAVLAPALAARFRHAVVIVIGLLVGGCGFLLMTRVGVDHGLAEAVIGQALSALGMAMVLTLTAELVVTNAPPERAGAASGLSETGSQLGGALGVALLGSLGAFVYRSGLADVDAPADAVAAARETLGSALEAAGRLPTAAGDLLAGAARSAFVDEVHASAYAVTGTLLVTAVVAFALLRKVARPTPPPATPPGRNTEDDDPAAAVEQEPGAQKAAKQDAEPEDTVPV